MRTHFQGPARKLGLVGAFALGAFVAYPAAAVDWSAVPGKEVVLFYPGQSSFEWTLTESDHSGGPDIREGDSCADCHAGEQAKIGNLIVSGQKIEPNPVKVAQEGGSLHVRMEWPGSDDPPPPDRDDQFEVKATLMIDDGSVVSARRTGCWAACHADMIGMPSESGADLTKYIARSRTQVTRQGGGENYKPASELNQMLSDGMFLEIWQVGANKGGPASAAHGYILEERHMSDSSPVNGSASLMSRPLNVGRPGYKALAPGKTYTVGFAIHDAHADHRFHHVSLEYTLVLGQGSADFVAAQR